MTNKQNLMPAEQAAKYLGVTTRTLANWRSMGYPNVPYVKVGRCIRYSPTDLDTYIAKHSHNVGEGQCNG
jgi:excisionase family DNA binding protein